MKKFLLIRISFLVCGGALPAVFFWSVFLDQVKSMRCVYSKYPSFQGECFELGMRQHNTKTQHNGTQHNTTQHNTTQHINSDVLWIFVLRWFVLCLLVLLFFEQFMLWIIIIFLIPSLTILNASHCDLKPGSHNRNAFYSERRFLYGFRLLIKL